MANEIKTIKLSDGSIYSIFDRGALRLGTDKKIYTDSTIVDRAILDGNLTITEIDDIPLADSNEIVLSVDSNGKIIKQNIRQVLRDLGCITANVADKILNLEEVSLNNL